MHIAIITAGGAGMFCGSCMHDNTWARALLKQGAQVSLLPTYTPIRVDEDNVSNSHVFFGGINIYLEYRFASWRKVPRLFTRWLDSPRLLNWATRLSIGNDAGRLGALTLAMLEGESGPQKQDVEELADFLGNQLKPDVVLFSNVLLVGALRRLRSLYGGPVLGVLQGDDVFLDALDEPFRSRALECIRQRAAEFDGFLVHSRYYRDFMVDYLNLPEDKFHLLPLGIDLEGHDGKPTTDGGDVFTVGYFARICADKGLHQLVDAFRLLHQKHPETRLRVGGYLGKQDREYFQQVQQNASSANCIFEYIGSPESHQEKVAFYKSLDVLSVPTVYREPKGLYVLEALANGVPVVQPRHGAFPEIMESTRGGLLVEPGDAEDLARALESLMQNPQQRTELATAGQAAVRTHYNAQTMAQRTLEILESRV